MTDAFDRLWTPHRLAYIRGENKPVDSDEGDGCPFCRAPGGSDEDGLIVARGRVVYTVLNLYPYTAGHLMVLPQRAVADLEALTSVEHAELWAAVRDAVVALKAAFGCDGVNVGLNLGEAAGGSQSEHLHVHCVPRWSGDANYLTVAAETRVLPVSLAEAAERIRAAWPP